MRPINRIAPAAPVQAFKTFQVLSPVATHFTQVSCEEFQCLGHTRGWTTEIDLSTDLGERQAAYIRSRSGRTFTQEFTPTGVLFHFPPGQACFGSPHQKRLDRESIHVTFRGDWRGRVGDPYIHSSGSEWLEDFKTHQDKIATQLGQG